ncbi:sialidase family protein [Paenibacillus alkalitolerans]|uniref:sialidase family protein n=1 Tax=Paenibacillus alkalitolerans TaxID=2799335 RepID=UPI0018F75DDE|nr:sialidase family protein [Paenibacillus alkalitolerans]
MKILSARKSYIFEEDRPFPCCHASTVLWLPSGDLLASWFGGTCEGHADVDIWISRCEGGRWSVPVRVAEEDGLPHWNPVLFQSPDGTVHLFYKVGHTIPYWHTRIIQSQDGGRTWSEPRPLVVGDVGGRGPVRNKPIVLSSGTWAAPASLEIGDWDAFVDLSEDEGETWTSSALVPLDHSQCRGKGVIQPALWESGDGQVHMLLRSTEGYIYRSDSADSGRTWSPAVRTTVPNNNSGIDLAQLKDGTLALVYNPVSGDGGARTPLALALSHDNGSNWEQVLVMEDGPGEYSYPSVTVSDSTLYVTYSWNRQRIAFWEIALSQ